MKKSDIKNLLFERFQERIAVLEKKRKENVAKMQKLINEREEILKEMQRLREETGVDIVFHLSETGKVDAAEGELKLQGAQTKAQPQQKNKGRRRRRKSGQPTIQSILKERLPEIVKVVGSENKEFTTRQVYDILVQKGLPKYVRHAHVSLYLSQNKKQLGIKSEAKKVKMPNVPMPVVTNFFTLTRSR